MEILEIKKPKNRHDIHPLIQKRWSPRAFSGEEISREVISEIFEAASWAASAMNEQPWQYIYATKGSEGYKKLWDLLSPGNQPWTKQAPVIFVALQRNTFAVNGSPNPWASHDVGMANAHLLLQAASKNVYGHLMAGFDGEKLKEEFNLLEDISPVCMGVLGYLGNPDSLYEPYKTRELENRTRKSLSEIVTEL